MQNSLDKRSLTLGCCSLEKRTTTCWYSVFSPFHLGLWKSPCKKNAVVSVGSFQKCMLSSCTQECTHCLTVNSGPPCSEDWFLLLFPLDGLSLQDSRPAVLVPSPALIPGAFCHCIGFVAIVSPCQWHLQVVLMGVGRETHEKAERESGYRRAEEVWKGEAKGRGWKSYP